MSTPTKIYLVLVTLLLAAWVVVSMFLSGGRGSIAYSMDPAYRMRHAHELTAVLRGRVDLSDPSGAPMRIPAGALLVDVRAMTPDGKHPVRRIGEVQPDGIFEIQSLPRGQAIVSIQLGGGETVWQLDDVISGPEGVHDPRIDPIDLGDRLFAFSLAVRDAEGEPVASGRLAWRASTGLDDDQRFAGIAQVKDGQAAFLSTSPMVDAVGLVPGARAELFEGLYPEDNVDLGPGTTVVIRPTGALPDPEQWKVRAVLVPVELIPRIEVDSRGFQIGDTAYASELDVTGAAVVPVPRMGRYQLRWWVVPVERRRVHTIKLDPPGDEGTLEIDTAQGEVAFDRTFPIDAFLKRAGANRRSR